MWRICAASGCTKAERGQCGYCRMHYNRLNRYGRLHNVNRDKGTGSYNRDQYVLLTVYGKRVYEHVHKAEKALGKKLPKGAVVHHINGRTFDNRNENLVVCPSQDYHLLLHRRMEN